MAFWRSRKGIKTHIRGSNMDAFFKFGQEQNSVSIFGIIAFDKAATDRYHNNITRKW